jgi:hypothetical protein
MNGHVALCLAAAARLQLAFDAAVLPEQKRVLLHLAADCVDKTCPNPHAAAELALLRKADASGDQLAFLVGAAALLLPVREYGWPARRVSPGEWPAEHARALRPFEQMLRQQTSCPAAARETLARWLEPAWVRYPQLREPVLAVLR